MIYCKARTYNIASIFAEPYLPTRTNSFNMMKFFKWAIVLQNIYCSFFFNKAIHIVTKKYVMAIKFDQHKYTFLRENCNYFI